MASDPNKMQLATTDLQPYMNPYTKDVTNATMGELNRQEALQGNALAGQAQEQGAFGGDRFAIQQAANNRDFDVTRAQALAGLNQGNFQQAQQGAQYDINNRFNAGQFGNQQLGSLSNLGFGFGQQLQNNQMRSGAMQQLQQQDIMNAIRGQYQGQTGQANDALNRLIQQLAGGSPGNSSKQTSGTTGLLGMAGAGLGLASGGLGLANQYNNM
jgi:hypothetical protein